MNLTLAILEKNIDGYHNLDSVFQKINLYDEIWIEKTNDNKFVLESNINNIKLEDNIIYKTYLKLKEEICDFGGIKVKLKKNIPMQAGLAGGSTDCASFLLAMNKLCDLNISKEKLERIGESLGGDVVPCMYNGAVWATGIGEKIKKINTNFKFYVIIIKPNFSCNTREMYQKLDMEEILEKTKSKELIKALENNNFEALSQNLMNNFEIIMNKNEEYLKIKNDLKKQGGKVLLAGSGSCVFGIFKDKQEAKRAYNKLKDVYTTYICTSYNLRRDNFGN